MKLRFWGVRGSIPVPGPDTARYGGNTPCLEVAGRGGECLFLEAGSGLRVAGLDLVRRGPLPPIHLFISHTHWDHIQGLPFFVPCYLPGAAIHLRGPVHFEEETPLADVFGMQMRYEFFPVTAEQLRARIVYEAIKETRLAVGGVEIGTQFMNHPVRSLGFRLTEAGRTLVYTGDHEPYHDVFAGPAGGPPAEEDALFGGVGDTVDDANRRFVEFVRGADLFVADCQYTPEEYASSRKNWGHSSWDACLEWMAASGARRMVLTHHDPQRSDAELDRLIVEVRSRARERGLDPEAICLAREGMEIEV